MKIEEAPRIYGSPKSTEAASEGPGETGELAGALRGVLEVASDTSGHWRDGGMVGALPVVEGGRR